MNSFLDASAGYVPVVGNIVDFAFKSNLANLGILESHLRRNPKYVLHNRWGSFVTDREPIISGTHIWQFLPRRVGIKRGWAVGEQRTGDQILSDSFDQRNTNDSGGFQ